MESGSFIAQQQHRWPGPIQLPVGNCPGLIHQSGDHVMTCGPRLRESLR